MDDSSDGKFIAQTKEGQIGICKANRKGGFLFETEGIQTILRTEEITRLKKIKWKETSDALELFIHAEGSRHFAYLENTSGNLQKINIQTKDLAHIIRTIDPSGNKPVRLLSCSDLNAAKSLSRALGKRPLYATEDLVRVHPDGGITTIARSGNSSQQWYKLEGGRKVEVSAPKKPATRYKDDFVRMGKLYEGELNSLLASDPDQAWHYLIDEIVIKKEFQKLEVYEQKVFLDLQGKISNSGTPTQTITNKYPNEGFEECLEGKIHGIAEVQPNGRIKLNTGKQPHFNEVDFVVTLNGQLVIGRKHHLLSCRNDVQAAGSLKLVNGKIKRIDNLSGHFKPTPEETEKFAEIFKSLGIDVKGARLEIYEIHSQGVAKIKNIVIK